VVRVGPKPPHIRQSFNGSTSSYRGYVGSYQ
jgi:hypothetical protein